MLPCEVRAPAMARVLQVVLVVMLLSRSEFGYGQVLSSKRYIKEHTHSQGSDMVCQGSDIIDVAALGPLIVVSSDVKHTTHRVY